MHSAAKRQPSTIVTLRRNSTVVTIGLWSLAGTRECDVTKIGFARDFQQTLASEHGWYNGEIGPRESGAPSVASISFHLGSSVFDGLMAYWNGDHYFLHRAEEHLGRFRAGAARMGLEFAFTVDDLLSGINELLSHEPQHTQYVRPIAYRRQPELWVTGSEGRAVDVSIFTVQVPRDIDATLDCCISPIERISSRAIPGHTKVSGAYVNSLTARRAAEIAGFNDGIMLDREGRIAEASAANFFAIKGGCLLTPPANPDVFPGITRKVILELARAVGIDTRELDMWPDDVREVQGAFLCSTLMEIRGIARLGDSALDTVENEIYLAVVGSFRKLVHG